MNYSWYASTKSKQSPDAIHQTLAFGSLYDIQLLKKTIGIKQLGSLFLKYPKKIYTAPALNFVKKIILRINVPIDEQKYLKDAKRGIE